MSFTAARALCLVVAASMPFGIANAVDVVTERYDGARLGANLQETALDTTNVDVDDFGKLWSYTVSGSVYAQPLFVHGVTIPGQGTHDVLYVVTMNDEVYAFDADSDADVPLLQASFGAPIPILDILGYNDNIIGNVGIESTPVIDPATRTMYFVSRSYGSGCGGAHPTFCQYLHAIDITTLAERPGSPVVLGGSVPGNGAGSSGGTLTFDGKIEDQRSSLALTNGRVFIAWSGHSDQFAYHGWVMVYDAATLAQTMIWSSAPEGTSFNGGGIWMGGRAPTVDAEGNVYYVTGNGTWDLDQQGGRNYGESFVKFGPTPDSPLLDWFTPDDVGYLNNTDLDLGGSGPILVPGSDLIASGGKSGVFYVTHTSNMGHRTSNDVGIVQVFDNSNPAGSNDQIKGGPVYWNRDGGAGPWMYVWSDGCNRFNAYRFNGAAFDTPPVSQSTILSPCGSSGGVLTLSANGSVPGSGIVWSSMPVSGDANSGIHPGLLRAFDADDLSTELWNSNQNPARDETGNWPKFSPPTVVDGRVYLGSFPNDGVGDTKVNVYGLLHLTPDFTLAVTPPNPGVMPGSSVTYDIATGSVNDFTDALHLAVDGLPAGASATFDANDTAPPATVTMTIAASRGTPLGEYALTIRASGGSVEHTADAGLYVTAAAPGSGAIGIDFVGGADALFATDIAGLVAKPNWNEAADVAGTALALLDESGVDTGAVASWSAGAVGTLGIGGATADDAMMDGYLDAGADIATVTVADLPAIGEGYYVYVYSDGANGGSSASTLYTFESGEGTATALVVDSAGATFDGTFIRADPADGGAGNYAVFFASGTGFTLTAQSGNGTHAPLNGIQIVRGDRIFGSGFD
jgi:hypothetical protein